MTQRVCEIGECDRPHVARGLCGGHYKRFEEGRPLEGPIRRIGVAFWDGVDTSGGLDACWPWTRGLSHGYGQVGRATYGHGLAHRVVYEMAHGPIPDGMVIRHACDNPPCCNPLHLIGGSTADNVADKVSRGRQPRGEKNGAAKLTDAQVADIRDAVAQGAKHREVAERFAISTKYVSEIITFKKRGEL